MLTKQYRNMEIYTPYTIYYAEFNEPIQLGAKNGLVKGVLGLDYISRFGIEYFKEKKVERDRIKKLRNYKKRSLSQER